MVDWLMMLTIHGMVIVMVLMLVVVVAVLIVMMVILLAVRLLFMVIRLVSIAIVMVVVVVLVVVVAEVAVMVTVRVMIVLIIILHVNLVKLILLSGVFMWVLTATHLLLTPSVIKIKAEAVFRSLFSVQILLAGVFGLHLEDKVAIDGVSILWMEHTSVGLKATSGLMPFTAVEMVKIVAPVEFELVVSFIVCKDFNVIVEYEPWHINWIEACAPGVERRGPEVHAQTLCLVKMADCWVVQINMAHLVTIDRPGDVVWGPLHLVDVPVVMRVKPVRVVMRFNLVLAIAIDDIHGEWVTLNGRNDLHIELVPLIGLEVGPVPVREEGCDGALSIRGLHARHELAVAELLVG